MPRKRKSTLSGSKGAAKCRKLFQEGITICPVWLSGDYVLCAMEMGIWWPGFIKKTIGGRIIVGFWNETTIVTRSIHRVTEFDKSSALISTSLNKLTKKKRDDLIEKYNNDIHLCDQHNIDDQQEIDEGVTLKIQYDDINEQNVGDINQHDLDVGQQNIGEHDQLELDEDDQHDMREEDQHYIQNIGGDDQVVIDEGGQQNHDDHDIDEEDMEEIYNSDNDPEYIPNSEDERSDVIDVIDVIDCSMIFEKKDQHEIDEGSDQKVGDDEGVTLDMSKFELEEFDTSDKHENEIVKEIDDDGCEQFELVEIQLKPGECVFDEKTPSIFIRKSKNNTNSKHGRSYDRYHACYYCKLLKTNIQTHMEHKHRTENNVKEILDLRREIDKCEDASCTKTLKSELHSKQALLRNKGNNLHNNKVLTAKSGEIIISRRRDNSKFDVNDYGPCPECEEWVILENMTKHFKSCSSQNNTCDYTKGSAILQSKILKGEIEMKASKQLKNEVFPSMNRDNITKIAQSDKLIVALGDIWFMKNIGNKLRRKNYTSFRMRLSARLLCLLQKCTGKEVSLCEFLCPVHFDDVVMSSLEACYEDEHENLKNPSTAIKLGYDVSRLTSVKLGFAIKENDEKNKHEATDFLQLMRMEWGVKVAKLAHVTLNERRFNKRKHLPHPQDIQKLSTYLVKQLQNLVLTECDEALFREAVILTETRLMLYNRRRPGELESISVDVYKERSSSIDEADMALRENLTEFEKTLLRSQDLVEIRGKTGRGVPLLIPADVKRTMKFLSNITIRKQGGIQTENTFLFANTGESVVRAGDALNEVKSRSEVNLAYPDRILATNLRKHTATIVQALNLNDQEMKWVCNHLGHTMKVHDQFYRQTSGLIERIEIAKLMLLQEHNLVGKYSNKKLSEIQFDEIIDDIEGDTNEDGHVPVNGEPVLDIEDQLDPLNEEVHARKRASRSKWNVVETAELQRYATKWLQQKKTPTRLECKKLIEESKKHEGELAKRSPELILKKISAMNVKARKLSKC